jgi:hypothetical protein
MRIFISHATADREIVGRLIDLLVKGAGVLRSDIFCTSAVGLGARNGEQFVNEILGNLDSAELVIAVLSQEFFASPFCLAEVGAAQVRKRIKKNVKFHALLIPPAEYETHLVGVLYGVQAGKIDAGETIDELKDQIANVKTPEWNAHRPSFLLEVKGIIDRSRLLSLLDKMTVTDTEFEFPTNPPAWYVRKLRVCIRNETSRVVELSNPNWCPEIAGAGIQHPYLSRYQRRVGANWDRNEVESITLQPGEEARLWLGLDNHKTPEELRMLHANRMMGTLEISAMLSGVSGVMRRRM